MNSASARLDPLDWLVIAAYAIGVLLIGWYYNRRDKDAEDYLVGGRTMRPVAVGLSFFVALFSTITYLAVPGEMVRHGPIVLAGQLALPLVFLVVGWGLIPVFMRLKVTSGYELLEMRLGPVVRLIGVFLFLTMRMMWMAVIIFATVDKVVIPLTGLSPHWTPWLCIGLAGITVVYTAMGGLRAIVTVDVIQSLLLFGGAFASLVVITIKLGGVGGWWPDAWPTTWSAPHFVHHPEGGRTILGAIVAIFVWQVCTSGSDQMAIQRYLATRNVAAARKMFGVSLIASVSIQFLLACLGLALLAYATTNPTWLPEGKTVAEAADRLFPSFIVTTLPAGLSGLLIAGLLAEAMNSLSSGLNASSSVLVTDVIARFRRTPLSSDGTLRAARWVSTVAGVVVIALSMFVSQVQGNLLEVSYKVVNLLTVPLFGLFFMAIFVRWATPFGAVAGAAVGVTVVTTINYWRELFGEAPPMSFLWAMPFSLIAQTVVGTLVSLLPIGTRASMRERAQRPADAAQDAPAFEPPTLARAGS